mgnify:CR=1 FL=1
MSDPVIIFDLDNTLYDEKQYYDAIIKQFIKEYFPEKINRLLPIQKSYRKSRDIFKYILDQYEIYSVENQAKCFELYKSIKIRLTPYKAFNKIIDLKKHKKFQIGLITNGVVAAQRNKIKCLGIEENFDAIIYARTWGKSLEKPHEKPFNEILKVLNCKAEDAIMVGDTFKTDILGASNLGISCFWITNDSYDDENITSILNLDEFYERIWKEFNN